MSLILLKPRGGGTSASDWVKVTPSGTVNGVNTTFTLPENADQVMVFADGLLIDESNYSFTTGTDTIEFNSGQQPFSTVKSLYVPS